MSVANPAFIIPRKSVVGEENEFVKMFDPQPVGAAPATPELLDLNNLPAGIRANPVPGVMAAAALQNVPSVPHTVQRHLFVGRPITTWDNRAGGLNFFLFDDKDNPTTGGGTYPAATVRVPRGAVFHGETTGAPAPHTIHWHGIEPTPINDGVGHCSMEIGHYFYQWQANFIGTYFYHCHRNTVQHFEFALFGLLIVHPPDAYFASIASTNPVTGAVTLNNIPIGRCRDGKFRTAANLTSFPQFPGFNPNPIDAPDPLGQFPTDPHAMTVPYDVEVFWVFDDRDSRWSDLANNHFATFPAHGAQPGVNDGFHQNLVNNFFAFNDYHPDYFFVTGVPVPAVAAPANPNPVGTINPSAAPPLGGIGGINVGPSGLIPPAVNSGVSGTQIAINAQVGQTILIRALDAAYCKTRLTLPIDMLIIAWDGRALGVPPFAQYTEPILIPANTPLEYSTARRITALIRATGPINSFATVEFINTRGDDLMMTARIPINITGAALGFEIFGKVTDRSGAPLAGVTMTLAGAASRTAVTDGAGDYIFSGLANGSFTVTPSLAGFRFISTSRNVTINGATVPNRNFTGVRRP